MNEIFKDIPDYEGLYQISNLGKIKSLPKQNGIRFSKEIILNPIIVNGYYKIGLNKNKKSKIYFIHRLVLLSFIGYSTLQVNHIDGNKLNNNLNNLEYCTPSENTKHAYKLGLVKNPIHPVMYNENNSNHKLKKEEILYIRNNRKIITQKELALKFNVSQGLISAIQLNKTRIYKLEEK